MGSEPINTTDKTTEQSTRSRRRRFSRDSEFRSKLSRAGRMHVIKRDLEMLAAIAKHRFLDARQVARLFACDCPKTKVEYRYDRPGKRQTVTRWRKDHDPVTCACSCGAAGKVAVDGKAAEHEASCSARLFKDDKHVAARLAELYHAGFLDRPLAQLQLRVVNGVVGKGSVPMVYGITGQGLSKIGEFRRDLLGGVRISRVKKGEQASRIYIEHTLAVADVEIAVTKSVRGDAKNERLSEQELAQFFSEERKKRARPFGFEVKLKRGSEKHELAVLCDAAFGIGNKHTRVNWNYMVEVDLNSMPVRRPRRLPNTKSEVDLSKTSIMRKCIAYAQAFEEKQHQTQLGWKNFRVLILTTSADRARNCAEEVRLHFSTSRAAKLFVFGELSAAKSGNILEHDFFDCEGKMVRLIGE